MDNLINKAKNFAYNKHSGQTRKGKPSIPFTNHLEKVAELITLLTDDEHLIASAWLHDVVEDTDTSLDEIYYEFGDRVGHYVKLETEDKRPHLSESDSWRIRKEEQLNELQNINDKEVYLITLSDKLANLLEMKQDLEEVGPSMWGKFNNQNPKDHEWYYRSFADIFNETEELKNTEVLNLLNETIKHIWPSK